MCNAGLFEGFLVDGQAEWVDPPDPSITDASASATLSPSIDPGGSGVLATNADVTFTHSMFRSNSVQRVEGGGGAVKMSGGQLTVRSSDFVENSAEGIDGWPDQGTWFSSLHFPRVHPWPASGSGGAIHVEGARVTIANSTFTGNSAGFGSETLWGPAGHGKGGAIYVSSGSVEITNGKFHENSAQSGGGAIYVDGGSIQMTSSEFVGNSVSSDGGTSGVAGGGAVHVERGDVDITNSRFVRNSAGTKKLAKIFDRQWEDDELLEYVAVNNFCSFVDPDVCQSQVDWDFGGGCPEPYGWVDAAGGFCRASVHSYHFANRPPGGAVFVSQGTLTVVNSYFGFNTGGWRGGAVFVQSGSVAIERSFFMGNLANGAGSISVGIEADEPCQDDDQSCSGLCDNNEDQCPQSCGLCRRTEHATESTPEIPASVSIADSYFKGNNAAASSAGALQLHASSIAINRVVLRDNSAAQSSGAVDVTAGHLSIESSDIHGNSALGTCGGVSARDFQSLVVQNTTLAENDGDGGPISFSSTQDAPTAAISHSQIVENTGGAGQVKLFAPFGQPSGTVLLTHSHFISNSFTRPGRRYADDPEWTRTEIILNSWGSAESYTQNCASQHNGLVSASCSKEAQNMCPATCDVLECRTTGSLQIVSAEVKAEHVVFENNVAEASGGALNVQAPDALIIKNSYIKGNTAERLTYCSNAGSVAGGGVQAADCGSVLIYNTTFEGNHAEAGGALHLAPRAVSAVSTVMVNNSVFVANSADNGGAVYLTEASSWFHGSRFEDNSAELTGSHILSATTESAYIYGTTFVPYERSRSVNLDIESPSCDVYPCMAGQACSFRQSSLLCDVCNQQSAGNDGLTCSACPAGKEPNVLHTVCHNCTGNAVSSLGRCEPCPSGTVAEPDHITCTDANQAKITDIAVVSDAVSSSNLLPKATLQLEVQDLNYVLGTGMHETVAAMERDIATALELEPDLVEVSNLRQATPAPSLAGRRQLNEQGLLAFDLLVRGPSAVSAMASLLVQLQDPASALLSSPAAGDIDPAVAPVFTFVCPKGTVKPPGTTACARCSGDRITSDSITCEKCPANQRPSDVGDTCICNDGYYDGSAGMLACYSDIGAQFSPYHLSVPTSMISTETGEVLLDNVCQKCDERCFVCKAGAVTVNPGFSISETSRAALDDKLVAPNAVFRCSLDGCLGIHNASTPLCREGYTGPLCSVCADSYVLSSSECIACSSATSKSIVVVILSCVVVFCMLVGSNVVSKSTSSCTESSESSSEQINFATGMKILIGVAQIIAEMPAALNLQFPANFGRLLQIVKLLMLDIFSMFSLDCVEPMSFHTKFIVVMFLPIAGISIVQLSARLSCKSRANNTTEEIEAQKLQARSTATYRSFLVLFMLYPLLSRTCFRMFSCHWLSIEEGWVPDDYSIDCEDEVHTIMKIAATICVLVYPIGVPLVFLWLLVSDNRAQQAASDKRINLEFLRADYNDSCYYFETVILLEKLLLSGLLVFISQGTTFQAYCGCGVAFCFAILQWKLWPYKSLSDNYLKAITEAQIFIILLTSVVLRTDLGDDALDANSYGVILTAATLVSPIMWWVSLLGGMFSLTKCNGAGKEEEEQCNGAGKEEEQTQGPVEARKSAYLKMLTQGSDELEAVHDAESQQKQRAEQLEQTDAAQNASRATYELQ